MAFKGFHYVVLAVVVGLVAVFAVHRVIGMRSQVMAEPSSQVVVAEADISSGTALNARLVKAVDWPQRIIPTAAASGLQQVEGRVTTVALAKGEPILMSKLAPEGTAAGLGGLLQEEMRAFTVRVDDVSGVSGFIHPGDRVDVLMALPTLEHRDQLFSKIILQDIKVLTAGHIWEQNADSKPVSVNAMTLEVTPEQSEVLNLATTQGKIRLILRSRTNKTTRSTPGVVTSSLINGSGPVIPRDNGPAPVVDRVVEVIKGTQRSTAKL